MGGDVYDQENPAPSFQAETWDEARVGTREDDEPTFTLAVTVEYPAIVTETATLVGLTKEGYDRITANPAEAVDFFGHYTEWDDAETKRTGDFSVIEIEELD